MIECCLTCAKSDEECEYCLRFGNHVSKDGKCNEYQPKEIREYCEDWGEEPITVENALVMWQKE